MEKQGKLFSATENNISETIELPQADLRFYPHFLSQIEAEHYQQRLKTSIQWEQSQIKLYGKTMLIPRLNAWYGDKGSDYQYSGTRFSPNDWTPELLMLKTKIEKYTNTGFNSVLVNCYRDGQDSVAWHSDDEPELGQDPVIASLSLGESRAFHLRHKTNKVLPTTKIDLTAGSLLIMQGTTQHYWQHQVPKTKKRCHERINLTFRYIY